MNLAICVIARSENKYINEWCHYHLKMGFNKIYLYDNNNMTDEYIGNFIGDDIKDKVEITDVREQSGGNLQLSLFKQCYDAHTNEVDWMAFFDVDEFLDLNGEFTNIEDFLNQEKFKNCQQIVFKWKCFGDDGVIERDESIPVYEFFKKDNTNHEPLNQFLGKIIIRGGLNIPGELDVHGMHFLNTCLPSGKRGSGTRFITNYQNETIFLNHYRTKTLKEFLETKFIRQNRIYSCCNCSLSNYFFAANDRTPEKEEYARQWIINRFGEGAKEMLKYL